MYKFIASLTQEERDILSLSVTDDLVKYLSPVIKDVDSKLDTVELAGIEVKMINEAKVDKAVGYIHKQFEKAYGEKVLPARVLNSLTSLAGKQVQGGDESRFKDEIPTLPSHATLMATSPTGHFELFDAPVTAFHCMELNLMTASLTRLDHDSDMHMMGGIQKVEIRLSAEQYVRFMRADSMAVPCTIGSMNGERYDAPSPEYHPHHQIRRNLKEDLTADIAELTAMEQELIDMVSGKTLTSKKAIAEIMAKFATFEEQYEEMGSVFAERKLAAAEDIVTQFKKDFTEQAQQELERLPESMRGQLYIPNL